MRCRAALLLRILTAPCLLTAALPAQVQWSSFPARSSHAMAYDLSRQRLVMYGGDTNTAQSIDETLEFTGSAWERRDTPQTPGGLSNPAMAWLPALNAIVLFGGRAANGTPTRTTWIFTGNNWSQQGVTTSPPPRSGHAMALQQTTGTILLFGGEGTSGELDDTWEFHGTNWTRHFPSTLPAARARHGMAFDSSSAAIVMAGGVRTCNWHPELRTVWKWTGSDWAVHSQLPPNGVYGNQSNHENIALTAGPPGSGPVLIGGSGCAPPFVSSRHMAWNGSAWVDLPPGPGPRSGGAAELDTQRGVVVMHGGLSRSDTWEWDGTSWAFVAGSPPGVSGRSMAFDRVRGEVVLFGGTYGEQYPEEVTWVRRGRRWLRIVQPGPVAGYDRGALVFDAQRGVGVYYGGYMASLGGGGWCNQDHYEWNGVRWTARNITTPLGRTGHAMAYHEVLGRTVLFGGGGNYVFNFRETWEFDGNQWSQRSPQHSPSGSYGTMCYDPELAVCHYCDGTAIMSWNGTDWLQLIQMPPVTQPGSALMTWDDWRSRLVFHWTPDSSAEAPFETWEKIGGIWQARTSGAGPRNNFGCVTFDSTIGQAVLFAVEGSTWEYGPEHVAVAVSFGAPCQGSNGPVSIAWRQRPWIGTTAVVRLTNAGAVPSSIGVMGFSDSSWSGVPLPLSLAPLGPGFAGCSLYVSLDLHEFVVGPDWSIPVPNAAGLLQLNIYLQSVAFDAPANAFGLVPTNALRGTLGAM